MTAAFAFLLLHDAVVSLSHDSLSFTFVALGEYFTGTLPGGLRC
jgi:hypothetical protein